MILLPTKKSSGSRGVQAALGEEKNSDVWSVKVLWPTGAVPCSSTQLNTLENAFIYLFGYSATVNTVSPSLKTAHPCLYPFLAQMLLGRFICSKWRSRMRRTWGLKVPSKHQTSPGEAMKVCMVGAAVVPLVGVPLAVLQVASKFWCHSRKKKKN